MLNNALNMKRLILLLNLALISVFGFAQDCASISIAGGNGQINITGISGAPIATVQVFNSSWASVFSQTYNNPAATITVSPLPVGQYFVNVRLYTAAWATICEKGGNATVSSGTPPAPPTEICGGTFQKTFGTTQGNENGFNIGQASDGNFIIVGQAAVNGTTNHDAVVMKVDNRGNTLWSKTVGGAQDDYFNQVVATADGGCLAAGQTNISGAVGSYAGDSWVVRFDGNGNILWQKRYFVTGSPGNIYALIPTSDGGYAFSGTFPFTPGAADWMVVKIDVNGNVQWQKKLGTTNSDNSIALVEDNTGAAGLIASGVVYSGTWYDAIITKLDMSGGVLWTKSYDFDSRANWLGPMYRVSDGLIFNTMNAQGYERENARVGILKTDFTGTIIWNKEYTIPGCRDSRLTPLPDGGFMMVQSEYPHEDPASDIYLLRIDAAGNVLWSKKYPRAGAQFLWGLATDGDHVMGGGFTASGSYNDILLTRVDLTGKMGNCSSTDVSTTVRTPVVTPLNFVWPINTALNLSTANTTYPLVSYSPVQTVLCSDVCPTVTVGNATVNENAGTASVQVCVSTPAATTLVYNYTTANGSATSGSDYTGGSGTVTIAAGQTCGTITIPILNDATIESAENFTVSVGSVSGTVTINDDDQAQGNCNSVTITPGSNVITVTGITAAVATVQVFNSSWVTVFNQTYTNAPGTVNVPIGPGTYQVKVTFYTSNWTYVCDKTESNVTVVNNCPAGAICISNTCPSPSVDLNTAYSPVLPAGTTVTWHTGTPATDGNKMTAQQAQNVTVPGTYYAAINISGANCYSATIPVNVTIVACSAPDGKANTVQVASESLASARNITVFPNPFTRSVRVIIDSEKREKAQLVLMDVQGRPLKQVPVQLMPGSNNFSLDGLDQFPSGNYFLKINAESGTKTLKLIRQQ